MLLFVHIYVGIHTHTHTHRFRDVRDVNIYTKYIYIFYTRDIIICQYIIIMIIIATYFMVNNVLKVTQIYYIWCDTLVLFI